MLSLPASNCLVVAVATPVTTDLRPDINRLRARIELLIDQGCDGIALFGTTGEGAEFSVDDRMSALEELVAGGIDPRRVIVSVGALAVPDIVGLSAHALERGVDGLLLMPPCVYRSGITEDGTFRFFSTVIERIARQDLRLYLYHFPDISGVPVTPQSIRRLDERYPGKIAGVKDSGGEIDFTLDLIRRFSHLSIFTGTEVHVPETLAAGGRGTICGLANVMPRLMRAMMDMPTSFDRRSVVPGILAGDAILCRRPFIPSLKAVVADSMADAEWLRVLPPMSEIANIERQRLVADFRAWDAALPPRWRSQAPAEAPKNNIIGLRRA